MTPSPLSFCKNVLHTSRAAWNKQKFISKLGLKGGTSSYWEENALGSVSLFGVNFTHPATPESLSDILKPLSFSPRKILSLGSLGF